MMKAELQARSAIGRTPWLHWHRCVKPAFFRNGTVLTAASQSEALKQVLLERRREMLLHFV